MRPRRLGLVWPLLRVWLDDMIRRPRDLPSARLPPDRGGIAGVARDLSVPTLIEAYRRGLFPGGHVGPVKWLSPQERCVLSFRDFHIGKDVRRLMRQERYSVTFDRAFDRVIKACAEKRRRLWHLTWITPRVMHAYAALHDAGHAHSYEVWNAKGELVGGGYGVAAGRIFFGESQFFTERNASKIASSVLMWHLDYWGFLLADAKSPASAMRDLGFRIISRDEFLAVLAQAVEGADKPGLWNVEAGTRTVAEWDPRIQAVLPPAAKGVQPGRESKDTKNPSVPVRRGVIRNPSSEDLTARPKSIARSPIA
jgi:leucyl/phenylalanyl-tRNA--protein transferase